MVDLPARWYCDTVPTTKFAIWSRGNAGEVYPGPVSPLSGSALFFGAGELGYRDAFEVATMDADEWDPSPNNLFGCFGGYLYLNMSIARLFGVRMPGMTPEMVDQQYYGDLTGIPSYDEEARPGDESPRHTERMTVWLTEEVFGSESAPEVDDHRREADEWVAARGDLSAYSDDELLARMRPDDLFRQIFCRHILNSGAIGVGIGTVSGICAAIGRPELAMTLIANVGGVDSAAPAHAMWELSRIDPTSEEYRIGFADLLDRFGSRGPREWELRSEVWGTHPAIATVAIDRLRSAGDLASPLVQAERLAGAREQALAEVRGILAGAVDEATQAQFEVGLRAAQVFGAGRERSKTTAILLVHEARLAALELGRRLVSDGYLDTSRQVFMLQFDELVSARSRPAEEVRATTRLREQQYAELELLEPPFIINGEPPPLSTFARRADHTATHVVAGDVLTGIPGCAGTAVGRARVILDPADPEGLEPGDILIAPVTDPAWTPLFVAAGAVVVDVGAQITHAVIVSRELGIPCVVSVGDATRRIPDGATIEVNGGAGTVTILQL
jgi:rifampicin phosphotransferase